MRALIELKEIVIYNALQIRESLQLSGVLSLYGVFGVKVMQIFNLWWIENIDYFVIAMVLVAGDHLLGSVVHKWWKNDFNWRSNGVGLLIKTSMVLMGMLVFEGINHIAKEHSLIYDYLKLVTRLVVLLYPARSIWNNMSIVTNGKLPPKSIIDKSTLFLQTLNPKDLKETKKTDE